MTLVGAAVTPTGSQTWPQAITAFESLTGRAMPVRRCYDSGVPSDITASAMKWDIGARRSVYSFKPSMSTPLSTLQAFASSIAAAQHPCDVIIYHEPVDNFTLGSDFIALYQRSAAPFRDAGISTGVCFTNWSCNLVYSDADSALAHFWPGDDWVDFISIDEYPIGEITSTKDAAPMDERTRRVCQFADARGIPLGLAEYGVDSTWDIKKSDNWLRSVADWARMREWLGVPLLWACYYSINAADGSFHYQLDSHAEYVDSYKDSCAILEA